MNKLLVTALILAATTVSANAKMHHGRANHVEPIDKPYNSGIQYRDIRVGDTSVVYHEIGTGGAQRGNTIVRSYNGPVVSVRPYEVRYDYYSN